MKADAKIGREVMSALSTFYENYSKRDLESLLKLLGSDPDVIILGTGTDEKRIGLNDISTQIQRDWRQSEASTVEFVWYLVSIAGSVAWVTADRLTHRTIAGHTKTSPSRLTSVLEKSGDKWLIMQLHHSNPDPGQMNGKSFSSYDKY